MSFFSKLIYSSLEMTTATYKKTALKVLLLTPNKKKA
tara:strand:- start:552 stop:662 length:111 start_codon:yes stop_codon:yes gene_type:complete